MCVLFVLVGRDAFRAVKRPFIARKEKIEMC